MHETGIPFFYPNETFIWTIMIAMYAYISGLVFGALVVTLLFHVFGKTELEPVRRFAILKSFSFLMFAAMPLMIHLGRPERAFNIMITPNGSSAMAGFGMVYMVYMVIMAMMVWFMFRQDMVLMARESTGLRRLLYRALSLWSDDISERALRFDRKALFTFAWFGIPTACIFHGYVGFLFGSLKSNPWWSTALMPIIFLMSAIVSGMSLLTILYLVIMWMRREPVDLKCLRVLCNFLWGFFMIDVTLELLELLNMAYEGVESWGIVSQLVNERLRWSFLILQFAIGSAIPVALLGVASLARWTGKKLQFVGIVAPLLILVQVFAMRWNVVIGGQSFSKTFRGLAVYRQELGGHEGLLAAIGILLLPFIVLAVLVKLLPPWPKAAPVVADGDAAQSTPAKAA